MRINNRFDKQIQFHCKRILGTVHIGLSTQAEGLLTKVRATTRERVDRQDKVIKHLERDLRRVMMLVVASNTPQAGE